MSPFDLTTLANVKAWLGLPSQPTLSDAMLAPLVTAASRAIYAALSRPTLLPQAFTETIDLETDRVYLRNWPVLQIDVRHARRSRPAARRRRTAPIPGSDICCMPGDAAPPGRPQALDLFGRRYHRRRQSLVVAYQAGYAVEGETWTAPSATPFTDNGGSPFRPLGLRSRRRLRRLRRWRCKR